MANQPGDDKQVSTVTVAVGILDTSEKREPMNRATEDAIWAGRRIG